VHRVTTSSLSFLAPGLLHQLGNQLFAVQGSAQLLPEQAVELRTRILAAAARGGETLRLLRALLGDPAAPRLPLERALAPLLDVARVSLRERGHQLAAASTPGAGGIPVEAGAVLEWTAQALCLLADAVPAGVTGRFTVATGMAPAGAVVAVCFEPVAGSLPFPLGQADVRDRLEQEARRAGRAGRANGPTCRSVAAGLELTFPSAPSATNLEA